MFLNALRMIIVPLIMSSIICGVANMGGRSDLGKLGGLTLGYYAMTSTLELFVGLFFLNVILHLNGVSPFFLDLLVIRMKLMYSLIFVILLNLYIFGYLIFPDSSSK